VFSIRCRTSFTRIQPKNKSVCTQLRGFQSTKKKKIFFKGLMLVVALFTEFWALFIIFGASLILGRKSTGGGNIDNFTSVYNKITDDLEQLISLLTKLGGSKLLSAEQKNELLQLKNICVTKLAELPARSEGGGSNLEGLNPKSYLEISELMLDK
jgi:hypothetical protein